jgi:glycosyltransferase involved in cell wall biosynthesis
VKKLSVIVPVLNEERTLRQILDRLLAVPVVHEAIVVDDGSTDRTAAIVEEYVARANGPQVVLLKHEKNRGKGAAIRSGLVAVTGEVVTIQDGDLEYDPADFVPMLEHFEKGARVVYGSRLLGRNTFSYKRFYYGGRLLSVLSNLLYGLRITDEPTCYKMFETGLMRRMDLECDGFEFCPEATAKAARLGAEIIEIPISYSPRSLAEGKKIRWWDGVIAIWTLLRYRFWGPRRTG